MAARGDENPPPRGWGSPRRAGLPLQNPRYAHLDGSNLRTRTPSPEPWSDTEAVNAINDEETAEELNLLPIYGRAPKQRPRRRQRWIKVMGFKLPLPLFVLFLFPPAALLVSLLRRSSSRRVPPLPLLSNGTHTFHPTTILVSIDGFRLDYLESFSSLVPNLISMGSTGLRARSMQPIFPSLTFPNHWAMLTGLYAESHGIVANDFWAPDINDSFSSRKHSSWDPGWWWGEPLWSVAERGGRRSAQMMWPGPPRTGAGVSPSFFVEFKHTTPLDKLEIIERYWDMDVNEAPSLVLTYMPDVDVAGHRGGPESEEVKSALKRVDTFVGSLREEIERRNLTEIVDLIIVSDHGMMGTSKDRLVFIDDILGKEGFADLEHRDGWPSLGLRFKESFPTETYLARLEAAAQESGNFKVYTHESMPERWHFSHGSRVAPIYLVPSLGWVITDHDEYEFNSGDNGELVIKGAHGYDNAFDEMQAIFFAQGPWAEAMKGAAPTEVDERWESVEPPVLKPFRNLELFGLIMRLQGLEDIAPATNGTDGFWDKYFV